VADLKEARRLGALLERMTEMEQDLKLLEAHRLNTLHPLEAVIYRRSRRRVKSELEPVTWGKRLMAVVCVVLLMVGAIGYAVIYGMRKGRVTNRTCFWTCLVCLLFDWFIHCPLANTFFYYYLPSLIIKRIGKSLDHATRAPYKFTTFIADGPACYIALERRDIMSSSMILGNMDPPFVNKFAKVVPAVLVSQGQVDIPELMSWFEEVDDVQKTMTHSTTAAATTTTTAAAAASLGQSFMLFLLGPLLLLPQPLQDVVFEFMVIAVFGSVTATVFAGMDTWG